MNLFSKIKLLQPCLLEYARTMENHIKIYPKNDFIIIYTSPTITTL
jgi:hypothetical protein